MSNEQLVLDNQKLAYYFAKKFRNQSDFDDIAQTAMIGLIKAAKTFDENKKRKFSTYASRCIQNEINMYFRKEKKHQRLNCVSLDELIYDDNGSLLVIGDTVADTRGSSDPEAIYENTSELEKALQIILNLEPKHARIIILALSGKPRKEIAEEYGYASISMIGRFIQRAKARIKTGKVIQDKYDVEIFSKKVSIIDVATNRERIVPLNASLYENILKIL